jgi:tetratricopeptide (TPR) repeat protein
MLHAAIGLLLFIPFFGWGIYTLIQRYRFHEEFSTRVEAATLGGLVLFYLIEANEMQVVMDDSILMQIVTSLGLFVSSLALYGHMLISFSSRLVVGVLAPGDEMVSDRPRFGPAEILERAGDYEDALQEYFVLLRIFPRHPAVHARVANCYLELKQADKAVPWFLRAMKNLPREKERLPVLTRLCDVYQNNLQDRASARAALRAHLKKYPESPQAETIQRRIARLEAPEQEQRIAEGLSNLDGAPLMTAPVEEEPLLSSEAVRIGLESLEESYTPPEEEKEEKEEATSSIPLEAMDTPIEDPAQEEERKVEKKTLGVEAIDTPLETEEEEEEIKPAPESASLSLAAMDTPVEEEAKDEEPPDDPPSGSGSLGLERL